ncbi:MAG: type II secretion system protein [Candidatus Omnitrophica bacterium]|nr:type II secretion system protein [Candidatus Omnitrophota bacterium]
MFSNRYPLTAIRYSLLAIRSSAFTLVELIVVIAIIGVLAAIITPNAYKAIKKAQIARTVSSLKIIKAAVQSYYSDTGSWITSHYITNNNGPFFRDPGGVTGWDGPYLDHFEKSPLTQPAAAGGGLPGWYYVLQDNQMYDSTFDTDGNGTYEIVDGISVCCYGFPSEDAYRLDQIFDGTGQWGYIGTMNVIRIWSTGPTENYYLVALLSGQTSIPRGSR